MKVLIIDDYPVLREGLTTLLTSIENEVVQAPDAVRGLMIVESRTDLDLIILDLAMPGMDGIEAVLQFGRKRSDLPVIVLSSSEDPRDVHNALASGARGYVPKSASQTVLLSAIRLVLDGSLYVPPLVLERASYRPPVDASTGRRPEALLTPRQIDVLVLLNEGLPNKAIATTMALSEKTVKAHITAIFKALNVVNRTQAAAAGRAAGII